MTEDSEALARFREEAIEWAVGGRGQEIVDAAAMALAEGLDSPSLRVLAGAPHSTADEEAAELGRLLRFVSWDWMSSSACPLRPSSTAPVRRLNAFLMV